MGILPVSTLLSSPVQKLLSCMYADAEKTPRPPMVETPIEMDARERFHRLRHVYMAIPPDFGNLLYSLAVATRAKTIVEFGTSMGVSAVILASALKDNGGGRLVTTEYEEEKIERARVNLSEVDLDSLVEFRAGDAMETLANELPTAIDFLYLDGAKEMYLDVLKLVEPSLRPGAVVAADNTNHEGVESFLAYVRDPANGYVSSAIQTNSRDRGSSHEISIRSESDSD